MLPKISPSQGVQATEQSQGDRDRLVLDHLPFVRSIAARVHVSLPVYVDLDDLVHAGVMGLFDAASKYEYDKQIKFQTYAKHRIKGAILDSLRDLDWASRDLRRRHKQLEAITRELNALLERNPTEEEIAEKMDITVEKWRQLALELRMVGLLSASGCAPEDENQTTPECPATDALNPDMLIAKQQLKNMLSVAMQDLPDRYRTVVDLYYQKDKTMREIGRSMCVDESRVSQIHKAALGKMAGKLQALGIHSSECLL